MKKVLTLALRNGNGLSNSGNTCVTKKGSIMDATVCYSGYLVRNMVTNEKYFHIPGFTFDKISLDRHPTIFKAPSFSFPLRSSGGVVKYLVKSSLVKVKIVINVCFRLCLAISISKLLACICAEWKSSRGSRKSI